MKLWNAEQVAEFLEVKPRTIKEKYQNRPDFPKPYRLSKRSIRWNAEEIMSFVKSCR